MNKYTLAPEWAEQDAVMLTWPHEQTDWANKLHKVIPVYIEMIKIISRFQSVLIICHDKKLQHQVQKCLGENDINLQKIIFITSPVNDTWARDHGPICLTTSQQQVKALDYSFNGWGNKYQCELDNQINESLAKQLALTNFDKVDFILEGGAIEYDGNGCLLTTKACLLNTNRNPHLSAQDIEAKLYNDFNLDKVIWLNNGALEGDDTDAHIDTLARFIPNHKIIFQGCQDKNDPHYASLNAMKAELQKCTNRDNKPYQLLELPFPSAQFNLQQERLPATYANFLIINQAILVPTYRVPQDQQALAIFEKAFPNRQIFGIDCREIIEQFGSLHCLTMQLPKGFLPHSLTSKKAPYDQN